MSNSLAILQWAILGFVLIVGLFFLWRRMNQLEERLGEVLAALRSRPAMCASPAVPPRAYEEDVGEEEDDEELEDEDDDEDLDEDADEDATKGGNVLEINDADAALMRAIFEQAMPGGAAFMMFSKDDVEPTYETPQVVVEEAEEGVEGVEGVEESERGTEVSEAHYSKTQLRKLSVDTLKEMLAAKGLPVDGNKNVLVQRLADA